MSPISWYVETIETPSLGDRSYVIHDGIHAAVVDPQRDLDRIEKVLSDLGVRVTAVLETHVHNDYVSGGPALAARTGSGYHLAGAELSVEHDAVVEGDVVAISPDGTLSLRAIHTPGHTPEHLAWVVVCDSVDVAVCTGGSMLFGSVGRTDLQGADRAEEMSRLQHRSVNRLGVELRDPVEVLPTHGFGSFCSSGDLSGVDSSTIRQEHEHNDALTTRDEDRFVEQLLGGLDDPPAYYPAVEARNRVGADASDLSGVRVMDGVAVRDAIERGGLVVDLRERAVFAAKHIQGSRNFELADGTVAHLAWMQSAAADLVLISDDPEDIHDMQRQLTRVGIDRPAGHALLEDLNHVDGSYPVSSFEGMRQAWREGTPSVILDVRQRSEYVEGHVEDALHLPLHELPDRLDEVPDDGRVWVHCASGLRASMAASLLAAAGREVVLIDDDVENAEQVGLPWVA